MAGYLGPSPVPQATQTRETFTATASQTSFATGGYQAGYIDVFLNGVKLVDGTDFTATNGSDVVLTTGAASGDTLEVVAYTAFTVADQTFTGDIVMSDGLTVDNDGATVLTVDRATSDGTIIDVQKGGSSVGGLYSVIGSRLGVNTQSTAGYLAIGGTSYYAWNADDFRPQTTAAQDLGDSAARFKDLYLSGGVYLGGTGAANKLDDYEEGNWTATYENGGTATYTISSGRYTKVGQVVHLQAHLDISSLGSASGAIVVIGLPFIVANDSVQYPCTSSIHGNSWSVSRSSVTGLAQPNSTRITFTYNNGSPSVAALSHSDIGTGNFLFNITYRTTA